MAEPHFIEPDEFARWLSPALALKLLKHLPLAFAVPAILFRIENDELRVAAEKRTIKRSMTEETKVYCLVPKEIWPESVAVHMHDDFWSTGDIRVRIEDRYGNRVPTFHSLINVRFDPAGIERLLPQPMPDFGPAAISPRPLPRHVSAHGPVFAPISSDDYGSPAPKRARANPVTVQEIKKWHAGLTPAARSLGVNDLWARAKIDHPGRHLPRKLVEHFGVGRSNGYRRLK